MSNKGICRTAPATPGLLIIELYFTLFNEGTSLLSFLSGFRKDNLAAYIRDTPSHYRWWQPIYIEPSDGGLDNSGHL